MDHPGPGASETEQTKKSNLILTNRGGGGGGGTGGGGNFLVWTALCPMSK